MSTDNRKVNVGLLPEQTEDYSRYEESELNWGRISFAGILILIIIFALIYAFLGNRDTDDTDTLDHSPAVAVLPTQQQEHLETEPSPAPAKTAEKIAPENAHISSVDQKKVNKTVIAQVSSPTNQTHSKTSKANKPVAKTQQKVATAQQLHTQTHPIKVVTPVKILDARIKKAQLSSSLIKGLPVDTLSSKVQMSVEGIIRVHLYTEMENLRGQDLYHHWYRNGEKQARVRIPVNHNHQRSSSSKFINKQMLGKWTVQVLDEEGKAYIEVNFEVVNP